ncbi:metal-dependent hydrolase [Granulicella sp. dw_53]|uniref:metal-dependent hydrolase n=1 Tax=Granulicella sp. dw_53 TaxID=2719792 RepID=UPI001BD5E5AA|nr:metal-dependent hydrolase [Granulicella sp. dw_53]
MDPITHLMTGACLARVGFNRKAAYATVAMTVAAELPDIDTLWGIAGPIAKFQHHRGWTHTFLGLPVEAAAVVGVAWLWHRWRSGRTKQESPISKRSSDAPVHWGLLFGFTLIALLSHLLLDWANAYGLRPFFPFNLRWYAGSVFYVVEPVLLTLLLVALIAPSLFGLVGSEVGAKQSHFRGRGWAIAALLGMVALAGWRTIEKEKALQLTEAEDFGEGVARVWVSPYPINPYQWHAVVEMPEKYQLAVVDTLHGTVTKSPGDIFYKPPTTIATLIAKRSWLGEVYLDWSKFPLVSETAQSPDPEDQGLTQVTLRDLRVMVDTPFIKGRSGESLAGSVLIDGDRKVVKMEFEGKVQR